jgi:hypothetical protein
MKYELEINATLEVPDNASPIYAYDGRMIGFKLADGRIATPVVAFEVEGPEDDCRDVSHEDELSALGIEFATLYRECLPLSDD